MNLLIWFATAACVVQHSSSTKVVVIPDFVLHQVEDNYVSYCMDAYLLETTPRWLNFNFSSTKLHALLTAMSPATLRFGGSNADWTVFMDDEKEEQILNKTGVNPALTVFTKQDLDNMVHLTLKTGNRFLWDLDLQLRYGHQWDPTNALQMLEYIQQQGYGSNLDFELGNEPAYYLAPGETHIKAEDIGVDFVRLFNLVHAFPNLHNSKIVGPDVTASNNMGKNILNQTIFLP